MGFTLDTVLLGRRMVRCHHGSQEASFAVSSCAVGLTFGPLVFVLPRQAPGLNSSPTPVNPTLWQLMVTTRPDCLCPGWTQLWTEFSQAVYFLSHGDVLGSPASLRGSVTHLGSFHCQPLEDLLICMQLICLYIYLILISGHTLSAVRNLRIIHRAGDPLFSEQRLDLCSKRYLTDVSYTSGLLVGDRKVWTAIQRTQIL